MKPSIDTDILLDKISTKIERQRAPQTANPSKRRQITNSIVGADADSAWSKIGSEMQENE